MNGKVVAYYRVSTQKQGITGLGMDAQRNAVMQYLNGGSWELLAEFAEVESGKKDNREELQKALAMCRAKKARLLIAKLDRLARNAAFLLNLRDSGVEFVAVDMPHADKFTVGIMALVAEKERDMISQRTKDGLAAAKRRGIKLGNPTPSRSLKKATDANILRAKSFADNLLPVIRAIQASGVVSLRGLAHCLNVRGFKTPTGRAFAAQSVSNILGKPIKPVANILEFFTVLYRHLVAHFLIPPKKLIASDGVVMRGRGGSGLFLKSTVLLSHGEPVGYIFLIP